MSNSRVVVGEETAQLILEGVNKIADAVTVTYGGGGNNVILMRPEMAPFITKDGVTVARHYPNEHTPEGAGISLIKQVAVSTDDKAGDSTTTSVVLAQALANISFDAMSKTKINKVQFKKGMDLMLTEVEEYVRNKALKEISEEDLKNVCSVSVNGEEEITDILTDTYIKTGKELGTIRIEQGASERTIVDYTRGSQVDTGYLNANYINNRIAGTFNSIGDCTVILYEGDINTQTDLNVFLNILSTNVKDTYTVAVFAESFTPYVLEQIYRVNTQQSDVVFMPVRYHSFGDDRRGTIVDYSLLTGASVLKRDFSNLEEIEYGKCVSITQDGNKTVLELTPEQMESQSVLDRVKDLLSTVEEQGDRMSPGMVKSIKERISNMSKGIATIFVGGVSEVEIREKIDRYVDALNSLTASTQEGIVIGSGVALLEARDAIQDKYAKKGYNDSNDSVIAGKKAVLASLSAPFEKILANVGIEEDQKNDIYYSIVNSEYKEVYNVIDDEYSYGYVITDPLKMVITSLKNAVSVVGTFLATNGIILNKNGIFNKLD